MTHLIKITITLVLGFLIVIIHKNEENINPNNAINETKTELETEKSNGSYLVNDSLYKWDEILLDWVNVTATEKKLETPLRPSFASLIPTNNDNKPIIIDWNLLQDIEYKIKYYEALKMEIYAPIFPKRLEAIDGKEVIIEGYVIPFDESSDLLALSANPFASCFFCGKASPASVMSLYLKKNKRYKMDDFKRFKGVLKLNHNDPEEYYYILKNAVPVK